MRFKPKQFIPRQGYPRADGKHRGFVNADVTGRERATLPSRTAPERVDAFLRRTQGEESSKRGKWSLSEGYPERPSLFQRVKWWAQDKAWERRERKANRNEWSGE